MSLALANQQSSSAEKLIYTVDGIDCADCAQKVESIAAGLKGAADARMNFGTKTLSLVLDEAQTPRTVLEASLKELGYTPTLQGAAIRMDSVASAAKVEAAVVKPATPWYATKHWRHVILTAGLVGAALAAGYVDERASNILYMVATVIGLVPLMRKVFVLAKFGEYFSINMLMSLAAVGAMIIGEAAEGAIVVLLFLLGEQLEAYAARRARAGIQALAALAPKTALLIDGGSIREVAADSLAVGQFVQVNPGARVPADGTISEGESSLDDSPVTGESVPVFKQAGDFVYAGSINTSGLLRVRVDKEAADNTIARIIHLVEEAEASRAPTARFIDRFSRVYSPIVVAIAVLVCVVPPLFFGGLWHDWLYKGLALLLIGCPCALVISVPAAITSGLSAGTRRGLLVKGGAALETMANIRTVAFDKTGTLTVGKPVVSKVIGYGMAETEVLRLAAAVEQTSSHPLAKAIVAAAGKVELPAAAQAGAIAGKAAFAHIEGRKLSISSPRHAASIVALEAQTQQDIAAFEQGGHTVVVLHDENAVLAVLALRDEARSDAEDVVKALKGMNVGAVMLTGDNARTGRAIAAQLGIDIRAELLPEDKLEAVRELKQAGTVAMVGDGINDAPALATADVGIAMGGGTDVALETADAALIHECIKGVAELIALARAVMNNIRWNIAIALGLKALFLVTTLTGTTNLWMAIFADTGATALVTLNAVRLLGWKPNV